VVASGCTSELSALVFWWPLLEAPRQNRARLFASGARIAHVAPAPSAAKAVGLLASPTYGWHAGRGEQELGFKGSCALTIHSSRTCFVPAKAWHKKPATLSLPLRKSA
jgi:hypothetical protein